LIYQDQRIGYLEQTTTHHGRSLQSIARHSDEGATNTNDAIGALEKQVAELSGTVTALFFGVICMAAFCMATITWIRWNQPQPEGGPTNVSQTV
jgi:hypothetical protein